MLRFLFALLPLLSYSAEITPQEVEKIATELYIYGYPLITMDLTRQIMTNSIGIDGAKAPMGQFVNFRTYPNADMHEVTTPNADTLYSWAWIDVTKEPYMLHVPDENGRYYLMAMLSGWTEVFADPGTRTTGTKAADYAITGPNFRGVLPIGVKELKSPTQLVWVIGRTYCNGTEEDYEAVHKIQDQYSLVPLSSYKKPYKVPPGKINPKIDMKTPVRDQVNNMDASTFFPRLALLMKDNPPTPADAPFIEKVKQIGFIPGTPFKIDPQMAQSLQNAVSQGASRIMGQGNAAGKLVNGWLIWLKTGAYGTDYLTRATVAALGLGANLPEDAIYPLARVDSNGNPFNGKNKYMIHFPKGFTPPVKGFWSLTLYNDQFFFSPNALDRYNLSSRDPLKYNKDGSLDLYIQNTAPAEESNWLPAPDGPFVLILRLYWPDKSVVNGSWTPPAVYKK